jgi:HEAT repeat protein
VPSKPPAPPSNPNDKNQLKAQGLAFGQAFQTVFKVSAMYSVDHPAAGKVIQLSYDLLKPLLPADGQFTFGFVNQRLLLNSSLVTQSALTTLDVALSKREIGAVTFQSGLTLKDFKRALAVLATRPTVIIERGGIKKFLAENPIEGIRIMPAAKREEEGDTIDIGMDIQSYMTAQAILGQQAPAGSTALDMLLQAAGSAAAENSASTPGGVLALANEATRNTVADPEGDLSQLLASLTQILAGMRLDSLVSSLPPEKQSDNQGQAPSVVAAHLMEDAIAGWAADRLAANVAGGNITGVGEEVLQALLRGLKATRVAERLLQKLARFVEQSNLPPEVYERIRREVMWFTMPEKEKQAELVRLERFTPQEFQRLLHYLEEAMKEGRFEEVAEITRHYFAAFNKAPAAARAEELERAPKLLRIVTGVQTQELMHTLAEPLLGELRDETRLHWPCHLGITNCLAAVAENASRFEDFDFVYKIASDLKRSLARHESQHADCCGNALSRLLPAEALERLVDSYLQKRGDAAGARTVTSMLTMIGPAGAEAAFRRLEEEPAASNRLPLIRLIRNLGAAAIEATRRRLSDDRWYVVRNAAYILGDLGDPNLPAQVRGALRHPDVRVQQAAVTAILKSHAEGRAEVLSEALPHLQPGVLELALDELTVLKDPSTVSHLEALLHKGDSKVGAREKAVITLAAIPSDAAAEILYKVCLDTGQAPLVRRAAQGSLYNHASAAAARLMAKLNQVAPEDSAPADLEKPRENTAA